MYVLRMQTRTRWACAAAVAACSATFWMNRVRPCACVVDTHTHTSKQSNTYGQAWCVSRFTKRNILNNNHNNKCMWIFSFGLRGNIELFSASSSSSPSPWPPPSSPSWICVSHFIHNFFFVYFILCYFVVVVVGDGTVAAVPAAVIIECLLLYILWIYLLQFRYSFFLSIVRIHVFLHTHNRIGFSRVHKRICRSIRIIIIIIVRSNLAESDGFVFSLSSSALFLIRVWCLLRVFSWHAECRHIWHGYDVRRRPTTGDEEEDTFNNNLR